MLTAIFLLGIIFIGAAYLVSEKNAKYLLSGYNTMSKTEQDKVAIKPFLKHLKKFHIFLGISVILIGAILAYFNKNWVLPFLALYPLLAYVYFLWTSKKFFSQIRKNKTKTYIVIIVVAGSLFFMLGIFIRGNNDDKLLLKKDRLIIEGFYGEEIRLAEIDSLFLTKNLPKITKRINGYAAGDVRKGYFQTEFRKHVKLILNSNEKPYLYIKTKDNRKIYYSIEEKRNKMLFEEIKKKLE